MKLKISPYQSRTLQVSKYCVMGEAMINRRGKHQQVVMQHVFGRENVTVTVMGKVVEEFLFQNVSEFNRVKAQCKIEVIFD